MGDSQESADWPDDDNTDWVRLRMLSPALYSSYLREFQARLETGKATRADLLRFAERCLNSARCLDHFEAQLPGLGLTVWQFGELRDKAMVAERAATDRIDGELAEGKTVFGEKYRIRQHPVEPGPRSRELAMLILSLSLRGLDDQRIACVLDVHDTWPAIVRRRIRIHPKAADAVAAHIAGASLGQVSARTGVPTATVRRILKLIGEQPHGAAKRVNARERARTIVRLRDKGFSYKEISRRLDCSMDDVKNALRRDRRHRYREGRGPAA
jgi:lambda repressor-like predicted transcriptional regulator